MKLRNLLVGLALGSLTACGHAPVIEEFPETASATDEVQRLEGDLNAVRSGQADVMAPESYDKAQNCLQRAKKDRDQGSDAKETLHAVAEGRAYLKRAIEGSNDSNVAMHEVVVARKQAVDAGAGVSFEKELRAADETLKETTRDIERKSTGPDDAKRRSLQAAYIELELKAIDHTALSQARATMDQAVREGAKDYASRSLAMTIKKIKDTDAYIVANRHETAQISALALDARQSADHLLKITRDSKTTKGSSSEDIALKIEDEQKQVNEEIDKGIVKQGQLDVKKGQLKDTQAALSEERSSGEAVAAQRDKLETEKILDQRYENARGLFTENEAEVYRQGDSLTIRLKGLEFPVAKAELRSSNYPLMTKVRDVIAGFGKSTVKVEGYTDSDGGKVLNERLSAARAASVSSYLVSTSAVDAANISSIGYGDQKPMASNKTAAGKAQNRRVDVVITPQ